MIIVHDDMYTRIELELYCERSFMSMINNNYYYSASRAAEGL